MNTRKSTFSDQILPFLDDNTLLAYRTVNRDQLNQ